MRNIIVTAASGQDRYTNSQKASYIAHSAIVHYPAIYVRYNYPPSMRLVRKTRLLNGNSFPGILVLWQSGTRLLWRYSPLALGTLAAEDSVQPT